jgi:hypothetical protein
MKLKATFGGDSQIHYASHQEMEGGTGTRYPLCWDNFNSKNMRGASYYSPTDSEVNCVECQNKVKYIKSLQE